LSFQFPEWNDSYLRANLLERLHRNREGLPSFAMNLTPRPG
jgi:hypothetical protein